MLSSSRGRPCGRGLFVLVAAWLTAGRAVTAAGPGFVLDLPGGGSLPGGFISAGDGEEARETLVWRSPQFTEPLEFRLDEVVGVRSAAGAPVAAAARGFRCRLQGGDVIDGDLQGLDAEHVDLVTPDGEALKIERRLVAALTRGGGAGTGYVGPDGLFGWEQGPASAWRDEAGRIVSDQPNAMLARDVGGPARARYEILLSWRQKPELRLAVAAGDGKAVDPFRFEMLGVGGQEPVAVLVRQEAGGGMLEPLELPAGEPGRLRLTLFVDQAAGRLAAVVPSSERVVDITVPPAKGRKPGSRFRLQLLGGDVCLERLRVSEWKAADPVRGDLEQTRVVLRDGTVVEGAVIGLDATGRLTVETDAGERTAAWADVEEVMFAVAPEPAGGGGENRVRVVRRSGAVLSGQLLAIADDRLTIRRAGIDRPVPVPLADLHSLVSLRAGDPRPLPGRPGTITVGGAEVPGCLVDAGDWGGGIAWQPRGSLRGSPLAGDPKELAAVVEYVPKATSGGPAGSPGQVEIGGMGGGINQDDEGFFVVTMLSEDGAAARDGRIQAGDRIVAVRPTAEGPFVETAKLDLATVMNLLRGRVGTPLGLRVQQGERGPPRRIELRRGLIYVADTSILDAALAAHARIAAGQGVAEVEGYPALLVLRSGDVVAAAVERADADGIRLRSPAAGSDGEASITVPHGLVRAVELDPAAASKGLAKAQWERLLTLPRSQQTDPPSHLLRLSTGDYLRGSLESLDGDEVVFSVLGQRKRIPRPAVVRLIWLHDDEIEGREPGDPPPGDEAAAPPPDAADGVLVQGIAGDGRRTTLVAERMDGAMIVGTSLALGSSRIDTRKIDRLLIGKAIDVPDDDLPFAKWRLKLAPLPRALRDE